MPRTKKIGKKSNSENKFNRELEKKLKEERDNVLEELNFMFDKLILKSKIEIEIEMNKAMLTNTLTKTLGEIEAESIAKNSNQKVTEKEENDSNKTSTEVNKSFQRSYSLNDDGYSTTESITEISDRSDRNSRSRSRAAKRARLSRSCSSRETKVLTPSYSIIPKINPKTPQTILRRPKIGETAISLQGSPLMVGNIAADTLANINIPLENGNCISIQPRAGLRRSEIPTLNPELQTQLKALRDNIELLLE